jgi:hypothetical protein
MLQDKLLFSFRQCLPPDIAITVISLTLRGFGLNNKNTTKLPRCRKPRDHGTGRAGGPRPGIDGNPANRMRRDGQTEEMPLGKS